MADPAAHDAMRSAAPDASGVQGLVEVMWRLRRECPWDAEQTHHSLVTYLVEEAAEVVDAIETGDIADLREELGDLLLQVVFHCEIEAQRGGFTLEQVAGDIAAKLVRRHPYVFDGADVPDDLLTSWEARKRAEKRRTSALDGIPGALDTLARAHKVIGRSRQHGVDPVPLVDGDGIGAQILALVARAQDAGIDADQATRQALRGLEQRIREQEASGA